ncbi:MAG: hypothetical protein AMXMBFR79_02880 [Chitinophagaceae bacterium]
MTKIVIKYSCGEQPTFGLAIAGLDNQTSASPIYHLLFQLDIIYLAFYLNFNFSFSIGFGYGQAIIKFPAIAKPSTLAAILTDTTKTIINE